MTDLVDFLPDLRMDVEGASDPVLERALLRAAIRFCDESDYVRHDLTQILMAPNVNEYDIAAPNANVLLSSIIEVRHDGVPLDLRDEKWLDEQRGHLDWRSVEGAPKFAIRPVKSDNTDWWVRIYPFPTDAQDSGTITGATQANPVVITSAAHGRTTGQRLWLEDIGGMTELNDAAYVITVVDVDSFSLDSVDGSAYTAFTTGGTWEYNDGLLDVRVSSKPTRTATSVDDSVYNDCYETILHGARSIMYAQPNKPWSSVDLAMLEERLFLRGIRDARFKVKEGQMDRSRPLHLRPVRYVPKVRGYDTYDSDFDTED